MALERHARCVAVAHNFGLVVAGEELLLRHRVVRPQMRRLLHIAARQPAIADCDLEHAEPARPFARLGRKVGRKVGRKEGR